MKTKFIKGTNKQYSIREDGKVIIHYIRHRYGIILHKNTIFVKQDQVKAIVIFINKKRIKRTSNSFLREYFNIFLCKDCNKYCKKYKKKEIVICKDCYSKRRKLSKKKSLIKTRKFQLQKSFYKRLFLDNNIISRALNTSIKILPQEVIRAKRAQLTLHRFLNTK